METDIIIQFGIFFFCIALLTFWFKKRWKKKPKDNSYSEDKIRSGLKKSKVRSYSEDVVGGKWTAEQPEPEPLERSNEPEPEPLERSNEPEQEPPEKEPKD